VTKLEEVILQAVRYAWLYDDACPDVGMGPNAEEILDRVLKGTSIEKNDFNYERVLKSLKLCRKGKG